jgi:hypothetical protein
MRKKFNEQIDYGSTPERMDPNLERRLKSPENLYAQNPAMKKGSEDVQRLVSQRFQKVAEKLRQVTGIENMNSRNVQQMIYQEMMMKIPRILRLEGRHREELEQLAIEAALEETQIPENWFQIDAKLNREPINVDNFRYEPEEDEEEEDDEKEKPTQMSFDIEDLTDEEQLELEKHKRNIINALIQGAAKKGHYIFQKPEVKAKLDAIDPSLYNDYLGIMAINDFLYFTMDQMIENMSQTGQGVAGKVELGDADDEGEEEGGEEGPDTKITAEGLIFPILCHEVIKGLEEAKGRHGLPKDPSMSAKVMAQTDILSNEPMQLRIGPEIVEKIRFALPDEMFDDSNKGLINWFQINLYQIPAKEFLEIIGNAVSQDSSKVKKATERFKEIMKEAKELKDEFESFQEEKGIEPEDDNDDEGLDDFLGGLGISRPK